MTTSEIENLPVSELRKLQKAIDREIESYDARTKKEALASAEAAAREHGFSLAELVRPARKSRKQRSKPKYRHPENPEITWTGRGRRPRWFMEAIEAGSSEDSLRIG